MSVWQRGVLSSGLGFCLILTGCANGVSEAAKAVTKLQQVVQKSVASPSGKPGPEVPLPRVDIDFKKLTPFPGGKGLIVCEPVSKSDTATTAFATSCTRWLHLAVAGQGQLAKTPLWDSVDAGRLELKKPNLRFNADDAQKLARKWGVTHVATSEISGNANRGILKIRLWQMPQKVPVGAVLTVSGSQPQILAALPRVASQLSAGLGITNPRLIAVRATPEEMRFLGQTPWAAQTPLNPAQKNRLEKMAARLPLAAMQQLGSLVGLAWSVGSGDTEASDMEAAVATLVRSAPENSLALSQSAWHSAASLKKHKVVIDKASAKYPHNYLIAMTEACWLRFNKPSPGRTAELAAAQRAVRSAALNPEAWTEISQAVFNLADDVRGGRYTGDLTEAQLSYIDGIYPIAYAAAQHATQLDSGSYFAWHKESSMAAFNGESETSRSSLWKAISIRPKSFRAYAWALQIYQPKWGGSRADLLSVVEKIKADEVLVEKLRLRVIGALKASASSADVRQFEDDYVGLMRAKAKRNPKNPAATRSWADALYYAERYNEAVPLYLAVLKLDPKDAYAHYAYGWIEHYVNGNYAVAEKHYVAAIAADPKCSDAINALGDITYYVHGDYMKAEELYRQALSIRDDGLYHAELARLMLDQGRRAAAEGRAKKALELGYRDPINPIWERLGIDPSQ